ncbi:hypothetical protein, partial [Desulfofundulus sp.]|uniref:hypothetical protein n=1 Tax=Desulfofundulus sp. TaxID=2282750 RepID=UPI003C70F0F2
MLIFTPGLFSLFFSHPGAAGFHPGYENRVAVLMYHHISNTPRGSAVITPQLFRAHLDILQKE